MKTIETGGPAFPGEWTNESDIHLTAPDGRVAPPATPTPTPRTRRPYSQRVERYDRCEHPSGPHPMHEGCLWMVAKTQGAI